MTIIKGIIIVTPDNRVRVKTVGELQNLPPIYEPISFNIHDKVYGLIIDKLFHIIYTVKLDDGTIINGYCKEKGISKEFTFIEVENFDQAKNDLYIKNIKLNQPIIIKENNIIQMQVAS